MARATLWLALGAVAWWPVWYWWLHHRYGHERVRRWEKQQETSQAKYVRWAFAYFAPLVAVVAVVVGVIDFGPAWRAAHGGGVPGLFTVVSSECDRKSCMTYGDFVASDGSRRTDVLLDEGGFGRRRAVGAVVAAHDTGDRLGVFPDGGRPQWGFDIGFLIVGAAYLAGWVVWLARRISGRRRSRNRVEEPLTIP